ncbi:MAG: malate/lactate/ureidoglycolate dehydrogenase [Betaproteobacteria bacterium]|nr:malate/lactate/ureidoglycolate dehydrogenase [Betaproteobacteria bacterium]
MSDDRIIQFRPLERAIMSLVAAGGSDEREARLVASNLVLANLCGHDSHGVGMVPRYVDALKVGALRANQRIETKLDAGALLSLDGRLGYGQSVGDEAMHLAIARARAHGSCIMTLANAHHLGRIGHWAEMAVAEGFVSIHFVNVLSHARVAPFGGSDARFGTNPCTIGVPLEGEPAFLFDAATSAVAQGKLRVAHNKGEPVPFGWLIDDRGRPTQDPRYAVVQPFGAMLPFGEHKGYGLAVACELLGGALTGSGTWHYEEGVRRGIINGMLTILIDAKRLGTQEAFAREAKRFLEWLRQSPPGPEFDRVRIAGEPEREMRARREKEGVPVDETTWQEILAAGAKLGLAAGAIETLARG